MDDIEYLLSELHAHDRVGEQLNAADGRIFLSGWNGRHPYVSEFLGDLLERLATMSDRYTQYSHMDEDPDLNEKLSVLHYRYGEPAIEPKQFAPGAGSSSFLASLLFHVQRLGHDEICYVPPVYYNAICWIRDLNFRVKRVARSAPITGKVELDLPRRRTCLWLSDPLWFAGVPMPQDVFDQVSTWQQATGSRVVVDGTFAYTEWAGSRASGASKLDPDLTYRLVCPTKALALHGFRFAYAIVPSAASVDFTELHGRMHGASSLVDRLFAHRAIEVLESSTPSLTLWRYVAQRHAALRSSGLMLNDMQPTGGYFAFARLSLAPDQAIALDSYCFDANEHRGFVRLNMLDDDVYAFITGDPQ